MVQFNEVYVPVFPSGTPETGTNLRLLIQIRNDRHSNQPLIQTAPELQQFAEEFNRNPRSIAGIVRKPIDKVRSLTVEAYPGTDGQSLLVLWARDFPTQGSVNILWGLCAVCFAGGAGIVVAYRRQRAGRGDIQIELVLSAFEAAAGKEARVTIPETQENITVRIPPGVTNGMRMRFRGKGRPQRDPGSRGDMYLLLRVR